MPERDITHRDPGDQGTASSVRYVDVTKRYRGADSAAVEHLNLEVEAGEICVLVGQGPHRQSFSFTVTANLLKQLHS